MRESSTNSNALTGNVASTGFVTMPVASLSSVVDAWRLTYNWLRRSDAIKPNKHRIHTHPQAATEHALVVAGWIGPLPVSTLTAIRDSDLGLPLDRCFANELNTLRDQGRTVFEVSLFGDRRREMSRTTDSLLWLMRLIWSWGRLHDASDFVIGVAPSVRRFYEKGFGFTCVGEPQPYGAVNDRPTQLMRCDINHWRVATAAPPAVQFLASHPAEPSVFNDRYLFPVQEVSQSPISDYLHQRDSDCND